MPIRSSGSDASHTARSGRCFRPSPIHGWRGGRYPLGNWTQQRLVVIEFPDMASAERFYDSPEYQKILPLRLKASKGRALLVEGA